MRLMSAEKSIDDYISHHFGQDLSALLAPIGENQVGESVRHNGVYFNIKEARQSDDPSLPLGVWTHDLRTADWNLVKQLALDALSRKSKDLQLLVWLFEANLHIHGFSGVAPAATLIIQLCDHYWDSMHPQMEDGDMEYRTNPINWINDKLTPVMNQIPITKAQIDGIEYSWEDWENAQRYEKLKKQQQVRRWDGPTVQSFKQRLVGTQSDDLLALVWQLEDGIKALVQLQEWLDERCGNEAPTLSDMNGLMGKIYELLCSELYRRGVSVLPQQSIEMAASDAQDDGSNSAEGDSSNEQGGSGGGSGGGSSGNNGKLRDRSDAFIALRKAAEYLMNDDPHSPVPYLIYTACEWGEKSAPDLYKELFLVKGGQLNIFEMMGLNTDEK